MKIAILIDEWVSGGMLKVAVNEAIGLRNLRNSVDVLTCTKFSKLPEDILYPFPNWTMFRWRFPLMSFFSPQHLLNIFFARRLNKYDLVIAHGLFSGLISVHSKTRVHLMFWDPSSTMIKKIYEKTWLRFCVKIAEWVDCYIAKKADRVMVASTYHGDWFMAHSIFPKIVHPGCYPKFSKKKREKIIIAVDRWDKGSDPSCLLDMIPPKHELLVIGKWQEKKLRTNFISKLLSSKEFKFAFIYDEVSEEMLNRLYDTASLLIHPTAESWGMQGQEAASRGCPIRFLNKAGINDIVPNNLSSKETFKAIKKYTWERHCKELLCD